MKKTIILAGITFPIGYDDIIADFEVYEDLEIILVEHPHLLNIDKDVIRSNYLSSELIEKPGYFFPILESWVSYGIQNLQDSALKFPNQIAKLSRSKYLLAKATGTRERIIVTDYKDAIKKIDQLEFPIVLRSDNGYSSQGLSIVENLSELEQAFKDVKFESQTNRFKNMKRIMGDSKNTLLIESFIAGGEYSMDAIYTFGGAKIIRVCEKIIKIVDSKPLCVGYWMETEKKIWNRLETVINEYMTRLKVSNECKFFFSMDLRISKNNEIILIDFGVRLGFDKIPYLVRASAKDMNPYSKALQFAMGKITSFSPKYNQGWGLLFSTNYYCKSDKYKYNYFFNNENKLDTNSKCIQFGYVKYFGTKDRFIKEVSINNENIF